MKLVAIGILILVILNQPFAQLKAKSNYDGFLKIDGKIFAHFINYLYLYNSIGDDRIP